MENNIKSEKKRVPGLIRQERVIPNLPDPKMENVITEKPKEETKANGNTTKKANINQQSNIKVSLNTKKQIDILLKFSNHKFAYELIDSMVDVYVERALDNDQKRAFKTLSKLISE
ncbi:hypothetical protein M3175_20585 [Robertmurraya korlensis]|uniref:hypothetical protein n=1 Tax=Robertmurraya korlensis TaxID=519977 RepID=UPI00204263DB|nr:hypothetical protein [Robertmurraya korlensis]MCM3603140.1 hypothetical protein [Robertmurraya korlensis]